MAEQMMQEAAGQAIPVGYKQTEVGIIPEDWDVYSVGDIVQRTQLGGNYENTEIPTDYPLIKMGNLGRGYINLDKVEYVPYPPSNKDCLVFGDVLFNTRNTLDLVGKVAIWRDELDVAYFNSNIMRFSFDKGLIADSFFISSAMNMQSFISRLSGIATGTTSVAAIYSRDLYTLKIAIPPKKEQTAIANMLSDSDALIGTLEQLIAKKQAIKAATMQQLLTGRTRLPQFAQRPDGTPKGYKPSELGQIPEDWEVVQLGEICNLYQPLTISGSDLKESGYPVYGANGLIGFYDKFNHSASQVIVTCRGSTCGTVNFTVPNSWITGNAMVIDVESRKQLDQSFVYYLLSYQDLTVCITGSGQPQIVRSPLAAFKIVLPRNEEQTAIATILSDMDSELTALEQKLAKARDLKQGMMQQLLTGRIRLPLEVVA